MTRRDWLGWFIGATLAVALLDVAHLISDLGRPFPGFITFRNIPQNRWYYDRITPDWWIGVTDSQLAYQPEALTALDGQPFGVQQRGLYRAAYAAGQRIVTFTVDNWELGAVLERQAPLVLITAGDLFDYRFSDFIVFVTLWLLALMLYRVQPQDPTARVAVALFCVIGAYRLLDHHTFFMDDQFVTRFLGVMGFCLYGPSIGALLTHFALRFPRPSSRLTRPLLYANYGLAALWMGGRCLAQFIWVVPMGIDWHAVDTWLLRGAAVHVLGAFALAIVRMCWMSWQFRALPSVTRPAGLFAAGLVVAAPAIAVYTDLALRGGDARPYYYIAGLDLRYMLIAIPLAIAYAVLRYRAFRSNHPLLAVVFVIASSALLASLATWVWGLTTLPVSPNATPPFVFFFAVALATGSLWSTQTNWRGALGRLFHWQERGFSELRAYADGLTGQSESTGLLRQITIGLVDQFSCERASIWLWMPEKESLELVHCTRPWREDRPRRLSCTPLQLKTLIRPRYIDGSDSERLLLDLSLNGCHIAAGLWDSLNDRPLGLLGIGKRKDEEVFDEHDLEILALGAHQAAIMLLAMRQIEALRDLPQRLLEAQRQERFRIAQDLHDTVQQRLGGVQPMLTAARLYLERDLAQAERLLSESASGIETAAQMVSRIRHDLAPPELAGSLSGALTQALRQLHSRTGIATALKIDADPDRLLSGAARQAVWLIVQQALDNVVEHAGAASVAVSFWQVADTFAFEIRDDGRGFSPANLQAAQASGSFGVTSMTARAGALGGHLTVTAHDGTGTSVNGWLPIASPPGQGTTAAR